MLSYWPKLAFFILIVRPVVLILLGLNVRGRHNLPQQGPAVIVANHNSHLDTLVLMCLFPISMLPKVRPIAAADYFMKPGFMSWFSMRCCGIVPLDRSGGTAHEELFCDCNAALDDGDILIVFPEGSRGDPENLSELRKGVFFLVDGGADGTDNIPVIPAVTHGLGRALPRGEALLVPFNCDVVIGGPIHHFEDAGSFVTVLTSEFERLLSHCITRSVE